MIKLIFHKIDNLGITLKQQGNMKIITQVKRYNGSIKMYSPKASYSIIVPYFHNYVEIYQKVWYNIKKIPDGVRR